MSKFNVEVKRISAELFEIEAKNASEAKEKALKQAVNMDWSSKGADYEAFEENERGYEY